MSSPAIVQPLFGLEALVSWTGFLEDSQNKRQNGWPAPESVSLVCYSPFNEGNRRSTVKFDRSMYISLRMVTPQALPWPMSRQIAARTRAVPTIFSFHSFSFQSLPHSFAQRRLPNLNTFSDLRTLSPLTAFSFFLASSHAPFVTHVPSVSHAQSQACACSLWRAYFLSPRGRTPHTSPFLFLPVRRTSRAHSVLNSSLPSREGAQP
jgi:hypothetical protein